MGCARELWYRETPSIITEAEDKTGTHDAEEILTRNLKPMGDKT